MRKGWTDLKKIRSHPTSAREGRKTTAFCGYVDDRKVTMGPDSFSEITMVSSKLEDASWERISDEPIEISGVGDGTATMGDRVMVPMRLRTGREEELVEARIYDPRHLPRNIDVLLGTGIQHDMKMKIDQGNDRLEVHKTSAGTGILIDLERPKTLKKRMKSRGLRVPDLASGSGAPYLILENRLISREITINAVNLLCFLLYLEQSITVKRESA